MGFGIKNLTSHFTPNKTPGFIEQRQASLAEVRP